MELMCNCLSFDFDFGLSFMYREKEIAGFMCILWQGFCTWVAHTPRGLKEISPYLKQPGFCVPVFGYTNYFINLSPLTQPFLTAILGQSGKCHGWLSGTMGKLSPMQTSCQLVSPPPQPPPPPPPLTNEYRAVGWLPQKSNATRPRLKCRYRCGAGFQMQIHIQMQIQILLQFEPGSRLSGVCKRGGRS